MNILVVTGTVTSEPTFEEGTPSGSLLRFPMLVHVSEGRPRHGLWLQCEVSGKKAERYLDQFGAHDHVTVRGSIVNVGEPRRGLGPIFVEVGEVIIHAADAMLAARE